MAANGDNLSAVLCGINDLKLEKRPMPVPKDDQALLQMEVVGICGSDVHYLVNGRIGHFIVKKPMVIGHEASGTVVKVGKNVKHLKPGDRVAIEPGVPCRMCSFCKKGSYHLCPDIFFCATPPDDGNLSRYYVHAADFCHKLPDNMDLEEGALMEPLSVGVHACRRGKVTFGDVVLILGAGPIGLVTVMAAKAYGASKIVIADIVDHRLKKAEEIGADCAVLIDKNCSTDDTIAEIKEKLGEDPTISFDCSGAETSVDIALRATKTGGRAVLVGMGKPTMTVPLTDALCREVDIIGVFRYVNCYPLAIEMVKTGKIDVKSLITHHFKLEDTIEAFETAKTGKGNPIKILIHPNPDWKEEC